MPTWMTKFVKATGKVLFVLVGGWLLAALCFFMYGFLKAAISAILHR